MHTLPRYSLLLLLLLPVALRATDAVTVSSEIFNGYTRERLPDKSFKLERYVFGEGGIWTRQIKDPKMEKLTFGQIGRVIAGPLAQLNYLPALRSADADILMVVFWGSTESSHDLFWDNSGSLDLPTGHRNDLDIYNAKLLGYSDSLSRAQFAPHMSFAWDTLEELGESRYYVVLQAYDFKTAVKHKKLKPLWTTRISVSEQGDFVPALDKMVWSATRYLGRDSGGLRRARIQEGKVDIAPLQVLEIVPGN